MVRGCLPSAGSTLTGWRIAHCSDCRRPKVSMSQHVAISPNEAADRLAIRELVEAYAHCADRRDAEGQMSLRLMRCMAHLLKDTHEGGAVDDPLKGPQFRLAATRRRCPPDRFRIDGDGAARPPPISRQTAALACQGLRRSPR